MSMAYLQFYKNKYYYPDYSKTLIPYGQELEITPVNINLKSGTILIKGTISDFMSCNYLSIERDNEKIYAFIEDIQFHTDESFKVTYKVDNFRTYINKCNLGVQYVTRHSLENNIQDSMLGSLQPYPDIESIEFRTQNSNKRYFIVQTRVYEGELISPSPVQPSPYRFHICEYEVNKWHNSEPISQLIYLIGGTAKPENIVTMYSVPYFDINLMTTTYLPVKTAKGSTKIEGWKMLSMQDEVENRLYIETDISIPNKFDLLKVKHTVQLVIPEAGIINIPDELLQYPDLKLRQDIDLFSGASNYMLKANGKYYTQSVRGSSISSIPIVSDPYDTYMSQNQNALATSLLGDIATIGGGIATTYMSGGALAGVGIGQVSTGITNIVTKKGNIEDIVNKSYSNPPAFLGTALATKFSGKFWVVITKENVTNESQVREYFGYPCEMYKELSMPDSGFIQTKNCNVSSDGTVPVWALQEINSIFNGGLRVR